MENVNTIGLFGTCDNIKWRDPFMARYAELGIAYFNPMVDDWNPGMVALEAEHLAQDPIILFPILKDSYGQGSLSEIGFGPLKAADPARAKDSNRSRKLVKGHLQALKQNNVYMVDTLDQMLDLSVSLHKIHKDLDLLQAQRA